MDDNVIEGLRLSHQQKQVWLLQQDGSTYRSQCAILIEGDLDRDALRRALGQIVSRHEILRTSFISLPGMDIPLQVVSESGDLAWRSAARDASNGFHHIELIDDLFDRQSQAQIDFERGPVLHASLFSLSPQKHTLLISIPSLCADCSTLSNLVRELDRTYEDCFSEGESREEVVQYAQFSEWSNELLNSGDEEEVWRGPHLTDVTALRLPFEKKQAGKDEFKAASVVLRFEPDMVQRIEAAADRCATTVDIFLFTCWSVLLGRLTSETDVVLGYLFDGRDYQELREAFGLFAHYAPVHCRVSRDLRFSEILNRVDESVNDYLERQQHILWQKVRESDNRGFIDNFIPFSYEFHHAPATGYASGVSFSLHRQSHCIDRFKIKLSCLRTDDSLITELHYDQGAFQPEWIEMTARYLQTLTASAATDPETRAGDLRLLGERDLDQLLLSFNETNFSYPQDQSIPRLFEQHVERAPDHIAIVFGDDQLSYAALNARANQLAHVLRMSGVGPDVFVGICLERSIELVISILATLKAGGAYLPLDAALPKERIALMLEDTQAPVVLTRESLVERLPANTRQVICLDLLESAMSHQSPNNLASGATPDNAAYVIYTSGTTGVPKGVVIEHRGVANLASWQAHNFELDSSSRIAQSFSYNFDGAVGETFMALLNGARLVMLDVNELGADRLIDAINLYGINVAVFVPSILKQLEPERINLSGMLTVVSVGEACARDLALKWSKTCKLMNGYGPTEYTVYSHLWKVESEAVGGVSSVPIGMPIHNSKTYILDSNMNPVPVGVAGEIYISGAGIARGYLNRAQITSTSFVPNKFFLAGKIADHGILLDEGAREQIAKFKRERELADPDVNDVPVAPYERLTSEAVMKMVEGLDDDLVDATWRFIAENGGDDTAYDGFCRYLIEGARGTYSSCGISKEVLRALLRYDEFRGLKGVDFGFGNGEIMEGFTLAGADITGFDQSPFFVQRARDKGLKALMAKIDLDPETFVKAYGVAAGSQDFAISTLVLDRIEHPINLLKNFFCVLKPGARFAIQTLLPIIPVDDGDVEIPTIYTLKQNRITTGETADRDKLELAALLHELGGRQIAVYRLPYAVASRDGVQDYMVWSFTGVKRADESPAFDEARFQRMYRTGDLGRYLPDGNIEFIGRADHQIKLRGFRIELEEIETAIEQHPGIQQVVVLAREDTPGDKRLVAYIVPGRNAAVTINELRGLAEQKLPAYMVPSAFVLLDRFPVTAGGKVDIKALAAPDPASAEIAEAFVAPNTPTQKALADIWARVLGVERVGINDNFFKLGGDSILSIQIVARANRAGLKLNPRQLFQHPTIGELAMVAGESPANRQEPGQALPTNAVDYTPSDFPLLKFNQQQFDQLIEKVSKLRGN